MNCVEDDLDELKSLQTKLHRLVTIRQTYIDSVVVKAKTKFLLTSRNLFGTVEKKQYDVLLLHVSQVGAVIDSLQSSELRALHEELEERTELIESKKIEASDVAAKAAFSNPDKTIVPVVPPSRTSTITMKLPTFDGKMINWRNFWSLFSSKLEHEPGLLDVDKSCLVVNSMEDEDAKERAQNAVGCSNSFLEAVQLLKSHYDNNRLLHRHYLDNLIQVQQFGSKGKDLDCLQIKLNSAVKGLKDSNGYTAGQIIVAIIVNMFDKYLMQGWREHIHDLVDPPDISHLQSNGGRPVSRYKGCGRVVSPTLLPDL